MDCMLMHKNKPVVDLEISEELGVVLKIGALHRQEHLPLGVTAVSGKDKGRVVLKEFNDWWTGRSIPASRDKLKDALYILKISSPIHLINKCYGLSLSDQYWLCPKNSGLEWKKLNFFQNNFSKDVGEILFGREFADPDHISLMSPDNTSDGWLKKKWIIADGKRYLMKGGSGVFVQEPFNEVAAVALMKRLNISHADYTLTFEDGKPYSLSENFITADTELIPAWRIVQRLKKNNSHSDLTHFLVCCDELGIPNVQESLDKMLTVDYIIANEDRHYNNFGAVRNAETLEWLGLAPVFDSGASLWYNTVRVGSLTESKPFKKSHGEQIKLVNDLSWFDYKALAGLFDEIVKIFENSEDVDETRGKKIAETVMTRAKQVQDIAASKKQSITN